MQAPPQIGAVLIAHPIAEMYGSDRVMLETIEAAAGRGWAVHVTVAGPGPLVEEIRHRGATVSYDNTPVLRKAALRPRGLLRLITQAASGLFAGLRLIRSVRPAVIYVSTLTIPLWVVIGRLLRVPVLVHMHDSERQAPRVLRRALAAPLLLAGRIVVNSDFSRSVLADSFPTLGRRAQVLYNGVPGPARPSPARPAIDGPARLLFLGRLAPRKSPADAVEDLLDDWPAMRYQVALDAVAAGRRFAPSTYRELIADHLDALAGAGMTG